MAQFLKLPTKKDFGLSRHRVTLPEGETASRNTEGESGESITDSSTEEQVKKNATPSPSIKQRVKGRVKSLFAKQVEPKGSPLLRSSPKTNKPSEEEYQEPLINFDDDIPCDRPSPVLHSRVLNKGMIGEGAKGSLENLKDEYGLFDKDDEDLIDIKNQSKNEGFLKMLVKSEHSKAERLLSIIRDPEGLGVRLSSGRSPVYITQVEPDSEAMLAGIKVRDVILEVDGRDCRDFDSEEMTNLLHLKSLIKKSPCMDTSRGSMKMSLTVTSIDSDTDESDSDIGFIGTSQDKVSIDEELFEYTSNKEKFESVMPTVKEEEKDREKSTVDTHNQDLLIDLSNGTSKTDTESIPSNQRNGSSAKSSPFKGQSSSKNTSIRDTLDLSVVPVDQERLGVDVGRYKRDIGNMRKKKPTRRRAASMRVNKKASSSFSDLWGSEDTQNTETKIVRTSSMSSKVSGEKSDGNQPMPMIKQKPPVAMKRTKSGSNSTSSSSLQSKDDESKRRYTVGGSLGQGNNSNAQLLAQAATARVKLRSSVKHKEGGPASNKDDTESSNKSFQNGKQEQLNENDSKSDSEKPAWLAGLKKKQENPTMTKDIHQTDVAKDTPVVESEHKTTTVPPKKPPRARDRQLAESKSNNETKTTSESTAASESTELSKPSSPSKPSTILSSNDKQPSTQTTSSNGENKPTVTPRKTSKTISGSKLSTPTNAVGDAEKSQAGTSTSDDDKQHPIITPRKPSIGQKKPESEDSSNTTKNDTDTSKDTQDNKPTIGNRPAVTPRKPSVDRKKPEIKDSSNQPESKDSNEKTDSTKSSSTTPAIGSVKSRMAMFERR